MEQYFLHLKSASPTMFTLNGNVVGTTEKPNSKVSVLTDEREVFLCCYPLNAERAGRRNLSYAAKLTLGLTPKCSSEYITLTKYPHNHIEVLSTDFGIANYVAPKMLSELALSRGDAAMLFSDACQTFIVEGQQDLLFSFSLPQVLTGYEITEQTIQTTPLVKLTGKTEDGKQYLLVVGYVNNGYEHLIDILSDKIEFSDQGELSSLELVSDIAGHGYVEKYTFDGSSFTLQDNYTVYMDSEPHLTLTPHLMPYAFMEALNVNNLKLARHYLSSELSSALSDQHLRTFFGDYCEVCWNAYSERPLSLAVIYGEHVRTAKIFDFCLHGNKISNITGE